MKKILLSLILLITSCTQTINYNENEEYFSEINSILYYKGSPFTGVAEGNFNNSVLNFKMTYKDGKLDGLWESYYSNGQLNEKKT